MKGQNFSFCEVRHGSCDNVFTLFSEKKESANDRTHLIKMTTSGGHFQWWGLISLWHRLKWKKIDVHNTRISSRLFFESFN